MPQIALPPLTANLAWLRQSIMFATDNAAPVEELGIPDQDVNEDELLVVIQILVLTGMVRAEITTQALLHIDKANDLSVFLLHLKQCGETYDFHITAPPDGDPFICNGHGAYADIGAAMVAA